MSRIRQILQLNAVWEWIYELNRFAHPKALCLFFLGFSAGLPYLLVSATLSAWLKEAGLNYSEIGFFAWVSLTFSIKFFWAPIIDSLRIPFLTSWIGHRRSWLFIAQIGIAVGLGYMAFLSPTEQMLQLTLVAIAVAFASATQDICVDAYRIQAVEDKMQGVVTTTYIAGYRLALLAAGAGALLIADHFSWSESYLTMSLLMGVGMLTVMIMSEPKKQLHQAEIEARKINFSHHSREHPPVFKKVLIWFALNVVEPFSDMAKRYKKGLVLILAVVLFYRVSDIAMGNMANPFYLALGYSKSQIAWVTKIFGLFMVLFGSVIGGILVARITLFKAMLVSLLSVILTNLMFSLLALHGVDCLEINTLCKIPSELWLGIVISADNLAAGASNVIFIAFLSHQVNKTYSATQYALLSSIMTLLGKFVSGYSGVVVEAIGFPLFFIYVALWGLPSCTLLLMLRRYVPLSFTNNTES